MLDRGYSLTKETQSGRVLRDVRTLQVGDQISTLLAEGSLISRVEHIDADED